VAGWTFESPILQRMSPHAAPKDIFQAACDELGRYFAGDGLRYVRSRPRLERKCGELTLVMAMWSSRNNTAGEAIGLEVVSVVRSTELKKWIERTGIGRNDAVFSVDTQDPETKRFHKYFDVWGMTPATFVEMAEAIRTWSWAPMSALESGEVPDPLPPGLQIIEDNYACWLWMRGERERALAVPGLEPELVAALNAARQAD
jgi:hypothetical protein